MTPHRAAGATSSREGMDQAPTPDTTREQILQAAEALLRRHGPEKLSMVDVARALGMSHANVYRYLPSKAALREAVAERWLHRIAAPLGAIAAEAAVPAPERLQRWLLALAAAKRAKVAAEPEMFAAYHALAEAHRAVVERHVAALRGQLARILADGAAAGEFRLADPEAAAAAVLDATLRYHHPEHVRAEPDAAAAEAGLRRVLALLLAGLAAGPG
jgi:AcrR family transcriptional regulator